MAKTVVSVHYTDQKTFSGAQGHLRVVFNIGDKHTKNYIPMMELIMHIVDRVSTSKLNNAMKQTALKSREAFNATKEKQQLEARREELMKEK